MADKSYHFLSDLSCDRKADRHLLWNFQQPSWQGCHTTHHQICRRHLQGNFCMEQRPLSNKRRIFSVVIGHNVSAIGSQAFYNCRNLKDRHDRYRTTRIGSQAFRNVKAKCVITIKSTRLTTVSSKIDQGVKKMTVRVPKAKYSAYNRLLRKHSRTVLVKRF